MKPRLMVIAEAIFFALVVGSVVAVASPGDRAGTSAGSPVKTTYSFTPAVAPVGSSFTYQGQLKDGGNPANGQYDFGFSLYDASISGTLVTTPITLTNQMVSDGLFTVPLDFGSSAFDGNGRWLEIAVRQTGGGSYTTLSPRQPITPAPYALFALKTAPYKNVVVVAQSGGQYTSISAALNSITDASATHHYLVWVGPGVYTETVTMKQWVDIEGAGEQSTKITSASGGLGTLVGANNAELRSLTVENAGGNTVATAIYNNSASPTMSSVAATASGGSNNYGVFNYLSSPNMTNVAATASGGSGSYNYGVFNNSSSPNMSNVTATASGGSYSFGVSIVNTSSPTMSNVTATASGAATSNRGVDNESSSSLSMMNVTATASGGSGSYNYGVFNNSSSPTMSNVTATASGGSYNYGVDNESSSSPNMTNVTATASGGSGSNNYGVDNESSSSPNMTNVTAAASGASSNIGVANFTSSPKIVTSIISASGGTNNIGAYDTGGGTVTIDSSKITSSTNTIYNNSGVTTQVGASQLAGGPVSNSGTLTCAGVYNGNYIFFPSTCP
jgi:hypothetical protein